MTGGDARSQRLPALAQLGGAVSANFGSAVGALGFPIAGPAPVVAVRQLLAAIVFLAVARPPIHRMRWRQLWPALVLGIAVVIMNLTFYFAVQRLGLGFAVTVEFLGPLGVALAATRRAIDGLIALAAFGGVMLLSGTEGQVDALGIVFALLAAGGWATYIVFSQVVGNRLPGLQGSAIAMTTAATCTLPILVVTLIGLAPDARLGLLASGGLAGLLSTIIPQAIDMTVLRRMSRRVFGVLQSASPALAAMVGFILLHQTLGLWQIAGLLIVSGANVVAVLAAGRKRIPVAVEPGAIDPTPTEPVGVVAGDGS